MSQGDRGRWPPSAAVIFRKEMTGGETAESPVEFANQVHFAKKLRFERICKDFVQRKSTIDLPSRSRDRFAHAARGGEPPARVPHDKTFPRKVLSPLLRFLKKKISPSADGIAGLCPTPHRLPTGGRNFVFCTNFHSRGFVKKLHKGKKRFVHATRAIRSVSHAQKNRPFLKNIFSFPVVCAILFLLSFWSGTV